MAGKGEGRVAVDKATKVSRLQYSDRQKRAVYSVSEVERLDLSD